MDFSLFLTIVAAAIVSFVLRKFRFDQENKEIDSYYLSPSSPPSTSYLSISSVPPSSPSHIWTHDVFPSFRGEDVRIDFLSHIQKEFERKGITPFNDDGIKRGESIGPKLISAIRGSKIAIVMLSSNYASSKWCLDELVEIMKCREELGQTVMTIFYKVDPSDVKKLTGDFGKVFRKTCVSKTKEDIGRWKQALKKVATIAGYHSSNWNNEASMVERIATDVSNEIISYVPSSDFEGFVGIEAHIKKMGWLVGLGSDEVRMIGIWGPSGIGKSTIARVLYSKYSHQFQLSVFMENIKRSYPRPCYDEYSVQLQLQEKFLSKIINQEDIKIHHLGAAPDRLKYKRVMVVLDDVDHSLQLDAMAKEARWFGPGSIIIITTQDKRLLKAHGLPVHDMYEVDFPRDDEAKQIFCRYAFGQKYPYDGFEKLVWEVTELCGKLPLALKVMGSYLKRMPKQEWEEELPRLRSILDRETETTLKFSYDALCNDDQVLFLHIACFFNNEQIERVEEYLADKFVGVKSRLRGLAEKSLISVNDWGSIEMHDLLARLGREIVRKQSIHERQFLVDTGDICQLLRNDTLGIPSVISINLKLGWELKISDVAFERMSGVQFLRLNSYDYQPDYDDFQPIPCVLESVNYLLPSLKFLHWDFCPMTCLPSNFNLEFMMAIILRHSNYLEKLWEENKTIRNLKWMDLSSMRNLKELPDLSTATNLLELVVYHCSNLVEIPSSIGDAINLQKLVVNYCSNLVEIPSSIGNTINLESLDLTGCSNLVRIPSSIWNLVNLQKLDLSDCSSLVKLPSSSSVNGIVKLEELNLGGCTSLRELPFSMGNCTNLEILSLNGCLLLVKFPISSIGNLRELYLKGCSSLVELPSSIINSLNLRRVIFSGCSNLVELPFYLGNLKLNDRDGLDLSGCSSLRELPSSIGNLTNLTTLYLTGCLSLVKLPSSIGNLTNLKTLNLTGCLSLVDLPSSIGILTNLEDLNLTECSSLVDLPFSIGNLHNLQRVCLKGCSRLKSLPININMESLDKLDLTDCSSLKSFPEISTNIGFLFLNGTAIQEIPPSIRSWPHLYKIHMSYCENLWTSHHAFDLITELHLSDKRIQEIAPWVKEMSRLEKLVIKGCTKLVSLPQLPDSLQFLDAENCESLERLDCFFYKTIFSELSFVNCFKLNREARDLIIKTSREGLAVIPGEAVPTYFTYRATESSLSMKSNGIDTHLRFKACVLLVNKGDVEAADWYAPIIYYSIKDKLSGVINKNGYSCFTSKLSPPLKSHMLVFEFETTVRSGESVIEFEFIQKNWEITECGLRPPETLDPSC